MSLSRSHARLAVLLAASIATVAVFAGMPRVWRAFVAPAPPPAAAPAGALFAPAIAPAKTDAITNDDADGKADPGETIRYTVTIPNSGVSPADDAAGVVFTDTIDDNTSLTGSVSASAVAVNDTFAPLVVGNVSIDSGAFSVLMNDYLGQNATATLMTTTTTSAQGGNVVIDADGTFSYNPPAGYEGADSFTYVLSDNANAPSAASNRTGTVSLTVSGMVWFVNNNAGACSASCDGRLSSPFTTLAAFQGVNNGTGNNPASNDSIFIYESPTAYTGGVTLLADQKLIGQDSTSSLSAITGLTPPAGSPSFPAMNTFGNATTIQNAAGSGVTLGTGNTLNGFTASTSSAAAISGTNFGTVTIADTAINGSGSALNLDTGTIVGSGFTSTTSSAGANNVALVSVGGTLNLGSGALSGATGNAVAIGTATGSSGGSGSVNYSGTITATSGNKSVSIRNMTGGTVTFSGGITGTLSDTGVLLQNNTGATIRFAGGLNLNTGSGNAFTATGGGTVEVCDENPCNTGSAVSNTLGATSGTALNITDTTIGANGVTFLSINKNGNNTAVILDDTGAGQLMVTGLGTTVGSGGTIENIVGSDAITLNNTDGRVTLKNMIIEDIGVTAGGFNDVSGHDAIHGQQVDGGLTLDNTTIRRISDNAVNGAAPGVNIPTSWNGLDIVNGSLIESTNRFHVANVGDANNEGMVRILGITGTVNVTDSTLQDGAEMLDLFVTTGTATITVTNNNFHRSYKEFTSGTTASVGNHCVDVTVQNAANAVVNIGHRTNNALDNDFLNCRLGSVRVGTDAGATGNVDTMIGQNEFRVTDHSSGFGGDFDFPMGGVLLISRGTNTATFDAVLDSNYFDEVTNASGGVGQFTLDMDGGQWNVIAEENTFDTPGNAPWFVRGDNNGNAGTMNSNLLFQNNNYIQGFFNCPDLSCAGGYTGPGLRSLVDTQFGANVNFTIISDELVAHDSIFDPGQTVEVRQLDQPAAGNNGTVCVDFQNNDAPDGYSVEKFNAVGTFNIEKGASNTGPCVNCTSLQIADVFADNGNTGGGGNPATFPPVVNVSGSPINIVSAGCAMPSIPFRPEAGQREKNEDVTDAEPSDRPVDSPEMERLRMVVQPVDFDEMLNRGRVRTPTQPGLATPQTPNDLRLRGRDSILEQRQKAEPVSLNPDTQSNVELNPEGDTAPQDIEAATESVSVSQQLGAWSSAIGSFATRLASMIVPTASAQELRQTAVTDVETVNVTIGTLPAGKSVTIVFDVTVDPLPAGQIRTRVVNQGFVSFTGGPGGGIGTTDSAPSADASCTAAPSVGTGTCTPVDRPDTSVTSVTRVGSTPSKAASVQWTITFADPIAELTASNLSLVDSAGPCTGEAITSVTGVGGGPTFTQYTVTAGTGTGDCTLRVDVANDGGISHDLTNDPFTIGETITIDKTVPTVLSINRASANPTNAASVDYTVTFSEAVSGVDPTDFLPSTSGVTGVSSTAVAGGPTVYTVSVNTGTGDGSFRIDLSDNDSIVDAAGNPLGGPGFNNGSFIGQTYNVDKTPPTVDIVDVTPDPRNTAVSAITINFTENVTGFDLADLTLSRNGGANLLTGAQTITGGAMSYSLNNLTGITGSDGTYVLTITAPGGITDAIGNSLVVGASEQWVMDTSKPNVTINQASGQPDPTFAQPINFTVVFNEPVTDFDDAADIDLSASTTPGTLTAIITQTAPNDGTTYNVAVSGATDDGIVVVTITNGAAADGAGNTSNPSTSSDNSVTFVTCTPPPSNMTAWYTGDGTLMDIAGGLDAASGGSPATVYNNGKVGQGFDLNGTSQWIERVDTTGMDTVPAAFSFDAWIFREGKLNPSAHEGVIVKMQDGAVNSQDSLGVFIQDTGAAGPAGDSFFVTYGGTLFNTANGTVPAINTWFHYAMTYDGANIRVYVNGALIDTRPYVGRTASSGPLYLGGRGAQHPFNGLIDEVEVFNKVLTIGEIQAMVAADSGGKCKPSDLSVTKTDGGVTTTPGQTITYTFAYANAGKAATGVTLTENVPANTTFNAAGSPLGWSCADGAPAGTACTFTVGSLASLGTGSVTFVATVVNPLPAGVTDIGNAVTIADDGANGTELDTGDNVATDFTPVTAQPDFSLTKSDGGVSVAPGGTVTYTLTYTNNGNQGAANVTLTETVPANTTFNSASSTGTWSCSNGAAAGTTCTQNVGTLAGGGANGTRNFAVTVVNPVAAGVNNISNTVSVTDDGANGADPTPVNNASDTTPVNAQPDLTITKTDGNTSTVPGGTVSYTLNYSNVGNQGATGVVLSETVPANTTFNAGASTAAWVCAPNGNAGSTCTLAVGSVNAGANGSATFAVTVNTTGLSGVTQISNTAAVADDGTNGADPTPANNSGSDTTPRNCQTITVNNPANASGLIGLPFSETFTQTGGFGTITFSTASTLPAGVTLSSAGVLSGTPSEIGSFPVVVTVTDGNGCTGTSAQYNLNITCNVNPVVQNSNDGGLDSLRYAVATACSAAGQNTVTFNMSAGFITTPISLTSGQIALTRNVNIQGPGANLLTVERNAAAAAGRVFEIAGSVTSQISGLKITGGSGPGLNGGGVQSLGNLTLIDTVVAGNTAERGAGIYHSGGGTLTLTRVALSQNNARKGGGLLNNNGAVTITDSTISGNSSTEQGGGIINTGISMSIAGSTISGNSAGTDGGGGIFNRVPLTIANSTISGNRTDGSGGGIHSSGGGGSVILRNSTITNNTADFDNNGSGDGGGVFDIANQFQTAGSIIAGNMDAGGQVPDISGAPISNGYNLIGKSDGSTGFTNGVNSDQVGTIAAPLNPQLAPLANNGGLTQTHALCVAAGVPHASCTGLSPAIDKGDDVVGSGFDQRGNGPNFVRPYDLPLPNFPNATGGDGSDIGAYELNNTPPTIAALPTTRQQGTDAVNSAVANVTDIESGNGSVVVTVNGGAFATVNGVTVNNIANNNGSVTANVVAACGATTATFTLTATDTGGLTATATLTVTVTPNTPPVLTYNNPAAIVFGQSGVVVSPATGPADNGAVVSNVLQSVGTYTGTVAVDPSGAVTLTGPAGPVGVHTITVRSTDNCDAFADATFQVTVNKAATTTTVSTSPNPSTYGQAVTLTATVVSNPPGAGTPAGSVTFRDGGADCATGTSLGSGTLNGSGVATLPVNTLTASPHTIRACYGGSASHLTSAGTTGHTVDKAVLTVTASSPTVTYGDAVPAITPSFTGFVLGESSTVLTTQPSCTTAYTQGSNVAGSPYQTSCSGAAAANYTFMYVNGGVTVNKKQLTVTADNKSRTYGAANPPLTSTITGFVLGETLATSGVTGTPSLSTTATPASPVGNYPITASAGTLAAANYSFTFANGTLTVTPATLTVTADNKTRVYGQPNPAFTFQIMGFANGETLATSGVTGAPALSTSATAASAPGSYPITITQGTLAAANYTFAFANGILTVTQAATTTAVMNAAALAAPTAVGQAYTVSFAVAPAPPGSGTPTGMVTVSDGTGATCTGAVAANGTGSCSLTSTTPGTKTITATYNGDVNFTGSTSAGAPHQVAISVTGNIRQYVPFGPSANLAGVTVTLAVNGINVSTATTDASGNYSFGLLAGGSSIVLTPSGLGKTYEPISRTYNNVTNNIANADFVAYDAPGPNANPREIRVVNTVATPGQSVTVPVEIVSLGNETSMSFTLAFDQALLGVPTSAVCGADFAGCSVMTFNTSTPGRAGITITRAAAFAAGVREAVRITFPTVPNTASSAALAFADAPVVRDVRNSDGNPVPALYKNGFVSFNQGNSLGFEGDVVDADGNPGGGDGVRANDVTVMRLFVLGLATADVPSGQFRRADAAPTAGGGDGRIDASDVTVVRLYNLGTLPPSPTSGPVAPVPTQAEEDESDIVRPDAMSGRTVSVLSTRATAGQTVTTVVQLEAHGDETSMSFTLNFDPVVLTYSEASLGVQAPTGTNLSLNTQQAAQGRLGVLLDATNTYSAGSRQILTVTFTTAAGVTSGAYPITFAGAPTPRSTSNAGGALLNTLYETGTVTFAPRASGVSVTGRVTSPTGQGLRNAVVTITNAAGLRRSVTTGSFGIYTFSDVAAGQSYIVSVSSNRFRFAPRSVTLMDSLADVNFTAMQ